MIKEFVKYLIEQKKEPIINVRGKQYNVGMDNMLHKIKEFDEISYIHVQTLQAVIDYLSENVDDLNGERLILHVVDSESVLVLSELKGDFHERICYMRATSQCPEIRMNDFIDQERFVIMLSSMFVETNELKKIRKLVSSVVDNEITTSEDDGITQQVNVAAGVSLKGVEEMPPRTTLVPFRTFAEATQPSSEFVLRAKKGINGPQFALFEADGKAWQNDAIENIAEWLATQIENNKIKDVVILS